MQAPSSLDSNSDCKMHQLDVLRDNDSCFESFSSKEYINKEMIKEAKYMKK